MTQLYSLSGCFYIALAVFIIGNIEQYCVLSNNIILIQRWSHIFGDNIVKPIYTNPHLKNKTSRNIYKFTKHSV